MIPFPDRQYSVIYADPPWAYRDKRDKHPRMCGGASAHYSTMSQDDLKAMPVAKLADKDCILFMWATFPNLPEALDVMRATSYVRMGCLGQRGRSDVQSGGKQ